MTETITYGGVKFLRHKELYEVRKGKIDVILYYTRQDTGESGMSTRSLANACGISDMSLHKLFSDTKIFEEVHTKTGKNQSNYLNPKVEEVHTTIFEGATKPDDFYLIKANDAHVIRDIYCERVIYYYSFESNYKKTKARELYQSLAQHGLRVFIQGKTGYQAEQAANHDNSLVLSIEAQLQKKVEELELRLVEKDEAIQEQQATIKQQARKIENLEFVGSALH